MRNGNKKIYHLEAWVVKVMSLYKVRASPEPSNWNCVLTVSFSFSHQQFFYNIDMSEFD